MEHEEHFEHDPMDHLRCQGHGCEKTDDLHEWFNPWNARKHHQWVRHDAYGIYTGIYCDECYENNYPYRKDDYYDPPYAGERMDDDY
jgi:hypothetical protein